MESQQKRDTIRMIERAYNGETLDKMLKEIQTSRKLNEILLPKMKEMSNEALAEQVGCSRAFVYGIMNGTKHPEKDMLLRIAFVLGMSVDDTQEMLKTAHRSALSSIDKRDICIIFGLVNGLDPETMDEVLKDKKQDTLFATKEDEKLIDIISSCMEKKNAKKKEEEKITEEELLRRVKCSDQLYKKIVEGYEFAPRDLLIRIAAVLQTGLTVLRSMLRVENTPMLSVENNRDMYIMNGIANKLSAEEMDEILIAQGQRLLWETFYDFPLPSKDDE